MRTAALEKRGDGNVGRYYGMETGAAQSEDVGRDSRLTYVPAASEKTRRPASRTATPAMRKIRCSFMIDVDLAQELRQVNERTGMSDAEQVRRGIRLWLESIRWPAKPAARAR
jgi:hypothetical protein